MSHPTDVLNLDLRRVVEAIEAAIDDDGTLVLYDEDGTPFVTLRDASATDTGAVGWVD
jgi:hypothetical protein